MRRAYQTDLSDAEWTYIEPHIPTPKAPGRPRVHTLREILDAIFYIVRSGCAWVHSANTMDWDGIKLLLERAEIEFPRLSHLWLDAGYRGENKGKDWVEKTLGWSVELVERARKSMPPKRR
jgi:transposase